MQPHIDVITLAVADLERAMAFYRDGLGLPTEGIVGDQWPGDERQPAGAVVIFRLSSGLMLCLYPRTELAKDAAVETGPARSGEFSIGHIVARREEVDGVLAAAKTAGATITDAPHERPWGIYSGYFRDLDGHLWEVIWNPPASSSAG